MAVDRAAFAELVRSSPASGDDDGAVSGWTSNGEVPTEGVSVTEAETVDPGDERFPDRLGARPLAEVAVEGGALSLRATLSVDASGAHSLETSVEGPDFASESGLGLRDVETSTAVRQDIGDGGDVLVAGLIGPSVIAVEIHDPATGRPVEGEGPSTATVEGTDHVLFMGRIGAAWADVPLLASAPQPTAPRCRSPSDAPVDADCDPRRASPGDVGKEPPMQNAALIAWLATAGGGLTMLTIWMAKGGVRQAHDETAGAASGAPSTGPTTRLDPWKVWSHVTVAVLGLALFILYMIVEDERSTGYEPAPWIALALLLVVAGLGLSMAIPWYQERRARQTAGTARRRQPAEQSIPAIIVLLHGLAASATIVLVALVAFGFD